MVCSPFQFPLVSLRAPTRAFRVSLAPTHIDLPCTKKVALWALSRVPVAAALRCPRAPLVPGCAWLAPREWKRAAWFLQQLA